MTLLRLAVLVFVPFAGAVPTRPFDIALERFEARIQEYLGQADRKPGNEPYILRHPGPARAQAAVLIHGMGDSPMTLRPIGEELHRRGANVVGVLLEGHGTTQPENLDVFGIGPRWERSVREGLAAAAGLGDELTVIGYSAGGVLGLKSLVDGVLSQTYAGRVAQAKIKKIVLLAPALGIADHTARDWCPHSPFAVWYYQLTKPAAARIPETLPDRHANGVSPWTTCQLQEIIDRYQTGRSDLIETIRRRDIQVYVVVSKADERVDHGEISRLVEELYARTEVAEGVPHDRVHAIPGLPERISEFVLPR